MQTTKPSGAPGSTFTHKLRSSALWPGPGQRISFPLASLPSALAKFCGSITLMDESSVRSAAAKTSDHSSSSIKSLGDSFRSRGVSRIQTTRRPSPLFWLGSAKQCSMISPAKKCGLPEPRPACSEMALIAAAGRLHGEWLSGHDPSTVELFFYSDDEHRRILFFGQRDRPHTPPDNQGFRRTPLNRPMIKSVIWPPLDF